MHKPDFSVVVPLYNKGRYIRRALRSVLSQTMQNFEVLVVNDGSTDDGPAIAEEWGDSRVRVIHQSNAGVSAARNRGMRDARADLISFLDADDEWKSEYLQSIWKLRQLFPDAGFYATAHETVAADGQTSAPRAQPGSSQQERLIRNFFRSTLDNEIKLQISTVSIPKGILEELGGFLLGEKLGEDLELLCRVAMKHSLAYSDQIGGIYYRNVENSAVDANMAVDELPFARTAWMAIESGTAPEHMASDINEYVVEEVLWYVRTQILFGNRLLARKLLRRCQTSRYRMRKAWWAFWAMVPSRGTRFAVQIKSRIKGVLP